MGWLVGSRRERASRPSRSIRQSLHARLRARRFVPVSLLRRLEHALKAAREAPARHPAVLMLRGSDRVWRSIPAAQRKVITIAKEMIEADVRSKASRAATAVVRTIVLCGTRADVVGLIQPCRQPTTLSLPSWHSCCVLVRRRSRAYSDIVYERFGKRVQKAFASVPHQRKRREQR